MSLERLWLAAWLDGLHRVNAPAVRPVEHPTGHVLLPGDPPPPYVPPQRTAPR